MKKSLIFSLLVMTILMVGAVSALTVTNPTVTPTNPTTEDTVEICADVNGEGFDVESVELNCVATYHSISDEVMDDDLVPGTYCTNFHLNWQDGEEVSCEITAEDNDSNIVTETVPEFTYDGEAPTADAGEDQTVNEGEEVIFDGSDSSDTVTATEDLIYSWDFGDESPVESEVGLIAPTHTYADNGEYEVTLTVEDEAGFVSEPDAMTITVENVNPIANANGPYEGEEGSFVQLTGSATDVPADTLTYAWDLNDDSSYEIEEQNPTFECVTEGTYSITLQVTDDDEGVGTDTTTVECGNAIPVIDELSVITPIDEEGETTLTAIVSDTGDDTTLDYEIDWGDGSANTISSTSDGTISANHQYMDDETYTISLTVSDGEDSTSEETSITVNNLDPWNVDAGEDQNSAIGEEVQFSGSAEDVDADTLSYAWDFGDGETSTEQNPTYSYSEKGIYTVTLTVSDEDGGSSTDTLTVSVYDYQIELSEDWNLISIPLVPENDNTDINNVFGLDISSNAEIIWSYTYDETLGKNVWKYNTVSEGMWSSDSSRVQEIIPGYGYYIKMNNEAIAYLNGKENYGMIDNNPGTLPQIHLTEGWNLIGHYGLGSKPTYCALYSLIDTTFGHPRWSAVYGYNSESKEFVPINEGNFNMGEGYLIEMDITDGYNPSTVCWSMP